ncbi:MAG TPA: hypothetical protein IAB83_04390 [Candidatus Faecousia faecavium]|nr:hypothetical protein [Candidatus Faecousia faecavium]
MNNKEKLQQIRDILGLANLDDFTILRWQSPAKALPEEAGYVIIKELFPDEGVICCEAAYENGRFSYISSNTEIPMERILGWTYAPYDERTDSLGRLRA